jgi:hypothetical protein
MDKKIVATPIPPDQPEAPRFVVRITGFGLVVGALAIVGGSFWPVVGPWLIAVGILIFIVAFFLLVPYWRPAIHHRGRDIRKLYGDSKGLTNR